VLFAAEPAKERHDEQVQSEPRTEST
jgi:hypothetical protein